MKSISIKLEELYQLWEKDTVFVSSITQILQSPFFEMIVNLGYPAVPAILRRLQTRHNFLFEALGRITGENPILPAHKGYIDKMCEDWIKWGKQKGYI